MINSPFFGLILAHLLGLVSDKNEDKKHVLGKLRLIAEHKSNERSYRRQSKKIYLKDLEDLEHKVFITHHLHQKLEAANSNGSNFTKKFSGHNSAPNIGH